MSTTVAVIGLAIIAILGIVFGIINFFYWRYRAKKERDCINKVYYKQLEKDYLARIEEKYKSTTDGIYEKENKLKEELSSLEKEIEDKKAFNNNLFKIREEELNRLIEEKKKEKITLVEREVDDWARSAQEAATENFQEWNQELRELREQMEANYIKLKEEVDDYQEKRNVINQEILRSRAMEEKEDFYRIKIDEAAWQDIHFLLSIIDRFNNKEIIYKLIWSEYIQKPFKNMINRILSNKTYKNVIYMIKNMKTGEIYIGKTKAEVSKRWTEHIKTSLNIGTISRSNIHKALFNNWDNFCFTILEEVPIEKDLSERERYYIKFYESDIFGYNIKSGG